MRIAAATTALTTAVAAHFPADVAAAITADQEMVTACAALLARTLDTPADIGELVEAVAERTPDHTLDWLPTGADSPAGWFYSQLRQL